MKEMLVLVLATVLTSCTLSFQNIDTHGTASQLVDENQATSPTVSPNVNVPVSALPSIPGVK